MSGVPSHFVALPEECSLPMAVVSNSVSKLSSVAYVYLVIYCTLISSKVHNVMQQLHNHWKLKTTFKIKIDHFVTCFDFFRF